MEKQEVFKIADINKAFRTAAQFQSEGIECEIYGVCAKGKVYYEIRIK